MRRLLNMYAYALVLTILLSCDRNDEGYETAYPDILTEMADVLTDSEGRMVRMLTDNNSHLIDKLIYQEQRFYLLRSDILTVGCLEQVLDTLGEIKLAILQVAGITGMEESICNHWWYQLYPLWYDFCHWCQKHC